MIETVNTVITSGAADIAFSPDGRNFYIANRDGTLTVYDSATQAPISTWNVGTQLGAMALSDDGLTLMVIERSPPTGQSVVYRVNTASGTVTAYSERSNVSDSAFVDVVVLGNDTVLLTGGDIVGGHGGAISRLDLVGGAFSVERGWTSYGNSSTIVEDGRYALFSDQNISSAPLFLYDQIEQRFIAEAIYTWGVNRGLTAVSEEAGLIVQFGNVYDLNIRSINLTLPTMSDGMTFSPDGHSLYLRSVEGEIVRYNAATLTVVERYVAGGNGYFPNGNGMTNSELITSADGLTLLFRNWHSGAVTMVDLGQGRALHDQTFVGTLGGDVMAGGIGDDVYYVNHSNDIITELPEAGSDMIITSINYTLGAGSGIETLAAASGTSGLILTGNNENNHLIGNGGVDLLSGGAGMDSLEGGDNNDVLEGGSGNDRLYGQAGNDVVRGGDGDDFAEGGLGNDTLEGGEGADTLLGGVGNDALIGNAGDDLLEGGDGDDHIDGGEGYNELIGGAGNDRLINNSSYQDVLDGGSGDHLYIVNNTNVIIYDESGNDTIYAYVDVSMWETIENLWLFGSASNGWGNRLDNFMHGTDGINVLSGGNGNDQLFGEGGDDRLFGGTGSDFLYGGRGNDRLFGEYGGYNQYDNFNDYLDGGEGDDILDGGSGDDSYVVTANDVIVEWFDGGYDIAYASENYALGSGVAVEVLGTVDNRATTAINLTGNDFDNLITGNAGNNILTGRGGRDYLIGRGGDDTYIIDNRDIIIENSGEGYDHVIVTGSYDLRTQVGAEIELLSVYFANSTNALNLTGNEFDNRIIGNAGRNTLDGNLGADLLEGGYGNDSYFVDAKDRVVEISDGGYDIVYARESYTLTAGAYVEVLGTIDNGATTAINLTGNELNNYLVGNAGANILDGSLGADALDGRGGNDSYIVDQQDSVSEWADNGYDVVYARESFRLTAGAHVEVLGTIDNGATTAINLTGNELRNSVTGNAGNNVLNGGAGNDYLQGRGGADIFVFDKGTGGDVILDFTSGDDRIDLSAYNLTFAEVQALFSQRGAHGLITLSGGDSVYLHNTQLSSLSASDFILSAPATATAAKPSHVVQDDLWHAKPADYELYSGGAELFV